MSVGRGDAGESVWVDGRTDGRTLLVTVTARRSLTSMLGLEPCTALEELYLSHNGISKLEGLAPLTRLKMLDVSSNLLTGIDAAALATLTQLEDLWLNDNRIPAIDAALDRALDPVRQGLTCIYLEGNPAVRWCCRSVRWTSYRGAALGIERTEARQGVEPDERDDPFTYHFT